MALAVIIGSTAGSYAAISSKAEHAILVDQISGNVMYSKNAYDKAYPASTTKLMTAILYYEKFKNNMGQGVAVTEKMMNQVPVGSSTMLLEKEEVVTREQLLYGLMLVSGNDAAIVMAYDHSGSIEAFVQEMNNKAKEYGMDSTHFANPHGFHDKNHYTTAADFAILAREYMKIDKLREIAGTSKYAMAATNKKEKYTMFNSNRLISAKPEYKDYVYDRATGLKTGFTNAAKNCFIGSASDGMTGLIWVGFGYETTEERFTESRKVFKYAFENFSPINVYKYIKDTSLYVDATSFNIPQYEYGNVDAMVQINAKETVGVDNAVISKLDGGYVYAKFRPLLNIEYPIKDGDYIGHIEYYVDDDLIYTAKAYATKYVEERKVPEFFNTAIINNQKGYGSMSFFEQAVSLGLENKEAVQQQLESQKQKEQEQQGEGETTESTETTETTKSTESTKSTASTAKKTSSSTKSTVSTKNSTKSTGSTKSTKSTSSTKAAS